MANFVFTSNSTDVIKIRAAHIVKCKESIMFHRVHSSNAAPFFFFFLFSICSMPLFVRACVNQTAPNHGCIHCEKRKKKKKNKSKETSSRHATPHRVPVERKVILEEIVFSHKCWFYSSSTEPRYMHAVAPSKCNSLAIVLPVDLDFGLFSLFYLFCWQCLYRSCSHSSAEMDSFLLYYYFYCVNYFLCFSQVSPTIPATIA